MRNKSKKKIFLLGIIALIGLVNALSFIFIVTYRQPLSSDGLWHDRIAWGFAQGHGLKDDGAPFIVKPPGYVIFVGLIYRLLGHAPIHVLVIQAVLFSACCILLYFIGRRLCGEETSLLAALLLSIYFPSAYYASGVITEILSMVLTALMVLFWLRYDENRRKRDLFFSGIFLGAGILCKPILAFFPAVIFLHLVWRGIGKRDLFFGFAILAGSVALTFSPWVLRNYSVFHQFIPLSKGNLGPNLFLSTFDEKYSLWDWGYWLDRPLDRRWLEFDAIKQKISDEIKKNPSLNTDRIYMREWIKRIGQDPFRYAAGCLVRVFKLWISFPSRAGIRLRTAVVGLDVSLMVLFAIGFCSAWGRWKHLSILWFPILYMTLLHLPFHIEARYATLAKPYFMIFVSMGILWIFRSSKRLLRTHGEDERRSRSGRGRLGGEGEQNNECTNI